MEIAVEPGRFRSPSHHSTSLGNGVIRVLVMTVSGPGGFAVRQEKPNADPAAAPGSDFGLFKLLDII